MTIKFILVLAAFIAVSVLGADEYEEDAVYKQEHCIKITKAKEEQLKNLVLDLGNYLTDLTMKYEDIDIRYVRIDIESHSEDEREEKEMILKVNINDCKEEGKPTNHTPDAEVQNNNNEQNHDHTRIDVQINDESDDLGNEELTKNNSYQEQGQATPNQENVHANRNVGNIGSQNQVDQGDVNAHTNFDNTGSQRQNQMLPQQESSVGYVYPSQVQTAVTMQRPTVTFLQLPENGQEMIDFLESRKRKKIEPVWVYMLEEGDKKEFVVFQ